MEVEVTEAIGKRLSEEDSQKLQKLYSKLDERARYFLGYQCNQLFDYSELHKFLKFSINNVGDPFIESTYQVNTKEFEREVLDFFAELMHLPKTQFWGYVTNGGTAGNMYGMYVARELYPDAIIYHSADSHYSIAKSIRVLNTKSISIKSQPNGEIDYADLEERVSENRHRPAIVIANIGTTMTGAIDNVEKMLEVLQSTGVPNVHVHCDAALGGMLLPFMQGAPPFDFRLPIGSMAISGHKMIGSPIPCGLAITRKKYVERIQKSIEYVGTMDSTLAGSRNGISPLFLWYAIKKNGRKGFEQMAMESVRVANYTLARLREIGWNAWINPFANVVVFDRPPEEVAKKWQIAVHGNIAHIYAMAHVTEQMIDEFIFDLQKAKLK